MVASLILAPEARETILGVKFFLANGVGRAASRAKDVPEFHEAMDGRFGLGLLVLEWQLPFMPSQLVVVDANQRALVPPNRSISFLSLSSKWIGF